MRGSVMLIKNTRFLDLTFYLMNKVILEAHSFQTLMKLSILLRDKGNFEIFYQNAGVVWLAELLRQNTVFLEDSGVSKCINALLETIVMHLE